MCAASSRTAAAPSGLAVDWLGACRRASVGVRAALAARPTTAQRAEEVGQGRGGDRTLVIDAAAEDAVFAELDALHAAGARFTALSEERGEVLFGGAESELRVVVDPIDGSLNAKRGVPQHALSIAVADGPTMADVRFAYVLDLGGGEEWTARRGEGAWLDGQPLDPDLPERRTAAGRLELVGLESADPRLLAGAVDGLAVRAHRLRAVGAIALSLCQVAAARFDAMLSLRLTRAVDAAAAQLVVREAGGLVAFGAGADPLAAPLDLEARFPVLAARSARALGELRELGARP